MDKVIVNVRQVVNDRFIGVGYHDSFSVHHKQSSVKIEKILDERWQECNPSFARVTHTWGWDMEHAVRQLKMMQKCGTQVYLTTWDPEAHKTAGSIGRYAEKVAGLLEELIVGRGLDNIRWYCMTNELSLPSESGWGGLYKDLPRFAVYHHQIYKALEKRRLSVSLLATDASPIGRWDSISWAARKMQKITGVYGGHHYINEYLPGDPAFYPWFSKKVKESADIAHRLGKPFIMGEFGPKQHIGPRYGFTRWDGCAYFDTAVEFLGALQASEAVIAAVNAGVDAIGYWTFSDYPDSYAPKKVYANKWGTVIWDGKKFPRRPVYFAMGLLSRFFRGPAGVHRVQFSDPALHGMAVHNQKTGGLNLAILNWKNEPVSVRFEIKGNSAGVKGALYVFDSNKTSCYLSGKGLLESTFSGKIRVPSKKLEIPAQSLVVFTEETKRDHRTIVT